MAISRRHINIATELRRASLHEAPFHMVLHFIINHPVFFVRNVKETLRLERVLVDADDRLISTLAGALTADHWNPLDWHWREALTAARIVGQLPAHPASLTYFSTAPIRYGKYVVKYRVRSGLVN